MLQIYISTRFLSANSHCPKMFHSRVSKPVLGLPRLIVRTLLAASIVAALFLIGSADTQPKSMSNGIVSDKKDVETAIIPVIQNMPPHPNVVTGLESPSELVALLRDSSR